MATVGGLGVVGLSRAVGPGGLDWLVMAEVKIIWACFCLCLSFPYCCFKAEMSTVNRSLSTLPCDGPLPECLVWGPRKALLLLDLPGDLKTALIPKVAATAIFSSSSSRLSSSSLYHDLQAFLGYCNALRPRGDVEGVLFSQLFHLSEGKGGNVHKGLKKHNPSETTGTWWHMTFWPWNTRQGRCESRMNNPSKSTPPQETNHLGCLRSTFGGMPTTSIP